MTKSIIGLLILLSVSYCFFLNKSDKLSPYDIAKSRDYAKFSSLAYCPSACLKTWSCKGATETLTEVSYFSSAATLAGGYIGYSSSRNMVIISFRGTTNIMNWMEDGHFVKQPYMHCYLCEVHSGFMEDYLAVASAISSKLTSLLTKYPTATVLSTGHSLGGALALICGMQLKRTTINLNIEVHTFGSPRVGNVNLAKFINNRIENIYRVVHNKDIVVHYPPDVDGFNYKHSAFEIFFNSDMSTYKTCSPSGEDSSCSNQYFPAYNLQDHHYYFGIIDEPQC